MVSVVRLRWQDVALTHVPLQIEDPAEPTLRIRLRCDNLPVKDHVHYVNILMPCVCGKPHQAKLKVQPGQCKSIFKWDGATCELDLDSLAALLPVADVASAPAAPTPAAPAAPTALVDETVPPPTTGERIIINLVSDTEDDAGGDVGSCAPVVWRAAPPSAGGLSQKQVQASTDRLEALIGTVVSAKFATSKQYAEIKHVLLNDGALVWGSKPGVETAMHGALRRGVPELVELLLQHGGDCHPPPAAGTAYNCYRSGRVSAMFLVTLLMRDQKLDAGGYLSLDDAVDMATLFIQKSVSPRAEVNSANNQGWTPFMTAAENSPPRLIELMLPYADLDQADTKGRTALHWACLCTNEDAPLVVDMLVQKRVSVDAMDSTGLTPADMARLQLAEAQKQNDPTWQAIAKDVLELLRGGKAVHVARVRNRESLRNGAAAASAGSNAATTASPTTAPPAAAGAAAISAGAGKGPAKPATAGSKRPFAGGAPSECKGAAKAPKAASGPAAGDNAASAPPRVPSFSAKSSSSPKTPKRPAPAAAASSGRASPAMKPALQRAGSSSTEQKPGKKRPRRDAAGSSGRSSDGETRRGGGEAGSPDDSMFDASTALVVAQESEEELPPKEAAAKWQESLFVALRKKPAMLTLVTHLDVLKDSAPTLQLLAESGLLAVPKRSILHVLASPPKKLDFKGVLHREPLGFALQYILPRGIAASPAERRLLRHCGDQACHTPKDFEADGDVARVGFLARLGVCRCSPLALALVKVRSKKDWEVQDGAFERAQLLYHLAGPVPLQHIGSVTSAPELTLEAAGAAAPDVKAQLDLACWPTRVHQMLALCWARAAAPAADSDAHMELAATVFESRPFLDQLQTVLLSVDPKVTVGARESISGAQLKPFVYVSEYASYKAFPKLPTRPPSGCKCARGEDRCCVPSSAAGRSGCACTGHNNAACGYACPCVKHHTECGNRQWQRGVAKELVLVQTDYAGGGWGVKAGEDIKKGDFVCEYLGEFVTDAELTRRESLNPRSADYTFQAQSTCAGADGKPSTVHIDTYTVLCKGSRLAVL